MNSRLGYAKLYFCLRCERSRLRAIEKARDGAIEANDMNNCSIVATLCKSAKSVQKEPQIKEARKNTSTIEVRSPSQGRSVVNIFVDHVENAPSHSWRRASEANMKAGNLGVVTTFPLREAPGVSPASDATYCVSLFF